MCLCDSIGLLFGIRYRPAVDLNMVHGTKVYQNRQYFYLYWKMTKRSVFVSVDKEGAHIYCIAGL